MVRPGTYIIQLKVIPFKPCLQEDKNKWWMKAIMMMTFVLSEVKDMVEIEYLNRLIKKLEKDIQGEHSQGVLEIHSECL